VSQRKPSPSSDLAPFEELGVDGIERTTEFGIYYDKGAGGNYSNRQFRLVKCPAPGCEFEWTPGESPNYHIADHDPEDFGL
jgi:hypothetical protein